jgi:hypothetical protein
MLVPSLRMRGQPPRHFGQARKTFRDARGKTEPYAAPRGCSGIGFGVWGSGTAGGAGLPGGTPGLGHEVHGTGRPGSAR